MNLKEKKILICFKISPYAFNFILNLKICFVIIYIFLRIRSILISDRFSLNVNTVISYVKDWDIDYLLDWGLFKKTCIVEVI